MLRVQEGPSPRTAPPRTAHGETERARRRLALGKAPIRRPRVRQFTLSILAWAVAVPGAGCGRSGWQRIDTQDGRDLRDVHVIDAKRAVAVGARGHILSVDGEKLAEVAVVDSDGEPLPVGLADPNLYAVISTELGDLMGGDGGIILARDIEGAFTQDDSRSNLRIFTLTLAGSLTAYAGGEGGRVLKKSLNETRWTRVDVHAPGSARITGSWAASETRIAFVTNQGTVIEKTSNNWVTQLVTTETSTTPLPLFGVWSASADDDLWVVGLGGSIYRRPSKSTEWRHETTPTHQDLYDIFGTTSDRIFAVGARGTILRYDGQAWAAEAPVLAEDLFAVHGTPDGNRVVAVGSNGALVVLED
ncbi:MAG: hypothetical protein IPK13_13205 [Deltaproteobacteria bacterium]|nr:hypothetical protein [Deltaproteobacteria bacterium]